MDKDTKKPTSSGVESTFGTSDSTKKTQKVDELMMRYGVDQNHAEIMVDRQKVYGDPQENHQNIAKMWAPLLQPWAEQISKGEPLPEHVVALMFCQLKMSRMRIRFHEDNYRDMENYLSFAETWQREKHQQERAHEFDEKFKDCIRGDMPMCDQCLQRDKVRSFESSSGTGFHCARCSRTFNYSVTEE